MPLEILMPQEILMLQETHMLQQSIKHGIVQWANSMLSKMPGMRKIEDLLQFIAQRKNNWRQELQNLQICSEQTCLMYKEIVAEMPTIEEDREETEEPEKVLNHKV